MTELDVIGRTCLSFTVSGRWGHFRRIDTTTGKQTYRVIPRTTVAGLIGAILGKPRDSYYDTFAPDASAIAIEPLVPLRTMQIPMLTLPTDEGDIQQAAGLDGKTIVAPEKIERERKRRTFEYVVEHAYRIDVVLTDEETRDELQDRLLTNSSVYTPCLGKTECLARINADREIESASDIEFTVESAPEEITHVDSIAPETAFAPAMGESYEMERTPTYMERDGRSRKTTGYASYAFASDGEPLLVSNAEASIVDGRTVCFM